MKLDPKIIQFISMRMKKCEEHYNIKVLMWSFRSSLDVGIYRKNSDLDMVFLFKNNDNNFISAIHDIVGYGFDFWGWNIEDAVKTLSMNLNAYYNVKEVFKGIVLSKEHERACLDYFNGIYCGLGNPRIGGDDKFIREGFPLLTEIMEKKILIYHILKGTDKNINILNSIGKLSSNEYLYTIWHILLSKHILQGGMPGGSQIAYLLEEYATEAMQEDVSKLLIVYRNALSKHSQRFEIKSLNVFIIEEYSQLLLQSAKLVPEHNHTFQDDMQKFKYLIQSI